jgi:hypothetical protein
MQFSHFFHLASKYHPQHPIHEYHQSTFFLEHQRPSFTTTQNNGKIKMLYILIFKFCHQMERQQNFGPNGSRYSTNLIWIFLLHVILLCWYSKQVKFISDCAFFSQNLLTILMLWLCPEVCRQDITHLLADTNFWTVLCPTRDVVPILLVRG